MIHQTAAFPMTLREDEGSVTGSLSEAIVVGNMLVGFSCHLLNDQHPRCLMKLPAQSLFYKHTAVSAVKKGIQ